MEMQPEHMFTGVKFAVAVVLVVVFTVSIPVNMFVIRVHSRSGRQTTFKFFIKALLVTDLGIFVTSISQLIFQVGQWDQCQTCHHIEEAMDRVVEGITLFSAGIIVAIATDRYEAICRPHNRSLGFKKARLAISLMAIVTLLWITVDVSGNLYISSWVMNTAYGKAVVFAVILLVVVGLYGKIWKRVRDRAKIRTTLRECACRVARGESCRARPFKGILKTTRQKCSDLGDIYEANVEGIYKISSRAPTATDNAQAVQFALCNPALEVPPLPGSISSTISIRDTADKTLSEMAGPSGKHSCAPQSNQDISEVNKTGDPTCLPARVQHCTCGTAQSSVAKMSAILVLTTIIHTISWFPSISYNLVDALISDFPANSTLHIALWAADHLCYAIVALNPFLYGMSSGEFRRACWDAIRRDFRVLTCRVLCQRCKK